MSCDSDDGSGGQGFERHRLSFRKLICNLLLNLHPICINKWSHPICTKSFWTYYFGAIYYKYTTRCNEEFNKLKNLNQALIFGAEHSINYNNCGCSDSYCYIEFIGICLDNGANIHYNNDEAFLTAAYNDNFKLVQFLLKKGADVHAQDDDAIWRAAECNQMDLFELLLAAGADVHANNDLALRMAKQNDHQDIIAIILNRQK